MNTRTTQRLAAAGMASAAGLAIAGFTALGSIFDYPKILDEPTTEILTLFRENQGAISAWFLVLAISAGLLAPVGLLLGRLAGGKLGQVDRRHRRGRRHRPSRRAVALGARHPGRQRRRAGAVAQADAHHTFELLHTWLGKALGETVGYALTATFTVLVVIGITRAVAPRWMAYLGYLSAGLIATGVFIPLGLSFLSITNFVGYVAWCLWLIAMAIALWQANAVLAVTSSEASDRTGSHHRHVVIATTDDNRWHPASPVASRQAATRGPRAMEHGWSRPYRRT